MHPRCNLPAQILRDAPEMHPRCNLPTQILRGDPTLSFLRFLVSRSEGENYETTLSDLRDLRDLGVGEMGGSTAQVAMADLTP